MHTSTLLSLALIRASLASPVLAANAAPVRSAAAGAPMSWGAYFAASPGVLGALAPEPQQAGALARLMDQPGIAPDGVQAFLERRDPDSQAQAALIEPLIQPMIDKALEKAREPQPDAHAAETAAATLRDVLTIADVPGAKLSDDSKARIRKDVEALRESAQAAAHLERLASARAPSFDGGVTHRAYARPEGGVRIENRHPSDDRAAADAAAAPIPDRLRPWLPSSWNKEDWTGRVTMHLHSVYSDGTMTPAAVVQAAYDKGVRSLALTDHDTFAGVPEAWEKVREINAKFPGDPIEFHPGAELSSQHGAHIGALDIDVSAPKLVALVERVRVMRYQRAQAIVAHLNARFAASDDPKEKGVRITIEEVAAKSQHANGGTIELPHIARVLVDKGLIAHVDDAFNSYLKGDIGGSAGGADPDAREVLEAIHAGGGKAFLNHPYTVRGATEADGDQAALDLLRLGMDGIEVYRPSHATSENGKRRLDQRVAQYLQWIEQLGKEGLHLLSAPGADFHGLDTHLDSIVVWMPKVLAQQLLDGLRSARDSAVAALDRVAARQPESAHHS